MIHFNIILPPTHMSSKDLLAVRFPTKILYVFFLSWMCATLLGHLSLLQHKQYYETWIIANIKPLDVISLLLNMCVGV
jgi:hypothetical protein